jgi:poly(3-hydroxybutyrate) depolymerase
MQALRLAVSRFAAYATLSCTVAFSNFAGATEIPSGIDRRTMDLAGVALEVHTYKPKHYSGGALVITLHGLNRNASGYLAYTRSLADRHGFLLVAPFFDRERFPTWRYQAGGIARYANPPESRPLQVEPELRWTGTLVLALVDKIRAVEQAFDLPYYLIGHSAGGQLLSRLAAFVPNAATRIVIANPSTYVWPAREFQFPYGFGGLPQELGGDEALRRYLAQPVTLFLGTADVTRDGTLNTSDSAMRQGTNRYERGLRVFAAARELAAGKGWAFNWRLVEAPGVSHSARRMYASAQFDAALAD